MNILICSDGTPASDNAVRLARLIAHPTRAQTTLFGIAEDAADEPALRQALDREAEMLRDTSIEIVVRSGERVDLRWVVPAGGVEGVPGTVAPFVVGCHIPGHWERGMQIPVRWVNAP